MRKLAAFWRFQESVGGAREFVLPHEVIAHALQHKTDSILRHYTSAGERRGQVEDIREFIANYLFGSAALDVISDSHGRLRSATNSRANSESSLQSASLCNSAVWDLSNFSGEQSTETVSGLLRQHHDLDRVGMLAAHLEALDEQLLPER